MNGLRSRPVADRASRMRVAGCSVWAKAALAHGEADQRGQAEVLTERGGRRRPSSVGDNRRTQVVSAGAGCGWPANRFGMSRLITSGISGCESVRPWSGAVPNRSCF